ncbi:MAG: hypothetical protein NTX30_22430, partial [Deltaproteobacteria bacterium]|nr:hypothetical protein [Deltaproteobacteria bacterium]
EALEKAVSDSPIFASSIDAQTKPSCLVFFTNGETCRFDNTDDLLTHPNVEPEVITGLEISKGSSNQAQVNVLLEPDGDVTLDITGPTHVVDGAAHSLRQRLVAIDQRYSWAARFFILNPRPRRIASMFAVSSFLLLSFFVGMYVYALVVGVNVNPGLIPKGMSYYQRVEDAINSSDLGKKLNVLLIGNYRGFTNVSDFLVIYRSRIGYCIFAFVILSFAAWVSRHLTRYYPRAYFALGKQIDHMKKIEKGREMWVIGIFIAFFVNLAAGFLILIFGQ